MLFVYGGGGGSERKDLGERSGKKADAGRLRVFVGAAPKLCFTEVADCGEAEPDTEIPPPRLSRSGRVRSRSNLAPVAAPPGPFASPALVSPDPCSSLPTRSCGLMNGLVPGRVALHSLQCAAAVQSSGWRRRPDGNPFGPARSENRRPSIPSLTLSRGSP
ncbi:hypothetical protein L1887_61172 [Cichorium endivia]|nr:hypothetical protein L1887_61172 [Cichorium endivia]